MAIECEDEQDDEHDEADELSSSTSKIQPNLTQNPERMNPEHKKSSADNGAAFLWV